MTLPSEFFTIGQLQTLGGLATAIYVVVTVVRDLYPPAPAKTVAVVVGVALSVAVTLLAGNTAPDAMLMAALNGFLAALAATGTSVIAETVAEGPRFYASSATRPWWSAWR